MDCFSKAHLRLLYMAGVNLNDSDRVFKNCWLGFQRFSVILISYFIFGGSIHVFLNTHDLGLAMAGLVSTLFAIQPIGNLIIGVKLIPRVTDAFKFYIKVLEESEYQVFDMKKILKVEFAKNTKAINIRMVVLFIMGTALIAVYIATNILYGLADVPCVMWYPMDTTKRPIFMTICLLQNIVIISVLLLGAAQDGLLHTLIRLQTVHAQYMGANLQRIPQIAEQKPKLAFEKLLWWIRQHQTKLNNEIELRNVFSPYLLLHYAITFAFVFAGIVSALIPTYTYAQKFAVVVFSLMYLIGLHRLCTLSEVLYLENIGIQRNGFSTNFVVNGKVMAKAMLLIQTRGNKSHILSAYGFYPLSNESFGLLLKATFSYIVATVQIRNARALKQDIPSA